jgi:hypothetical protein
MDFWIQAKIEIPADKIQHITAFVSEEKLKYGLYCCILGFLCMSITIILMILLRRSLLLQQSDYSKILTTKYETLLSESMSFFYENGQIFQKKELSVYLDKSPNSIKTDFTSKKARQWVGSCHIGEFISAFRFQKTVA